MKNFLSLLLAFAFVHGACLVSGQSTAVPGQVEVARHGDSVIAGTIDHKPVRVVLSTYELEIGTAHPSPMDRRTNCLYTKRPCSQVSNISISVGGNGSSSPDRVCGLH